MQSNHIAKGFSTHRETEIGSQSNLQIYSTEQSSHRAEQPQIRAATDQSSHRAAATEQNSYRTEQPQRGEATEQIQVTITDQKRAEQLQSDTGRSITYRAKITEP